MSKWECSYSMVITSGCSHRSAPFSRAISKKQPAQLIICNEHDWEIPTAQWLNCVPAIFKSVAFVVGTKPNSCDMQLHLSMMMGHRHNYLILKKTVIHNGQAVYFIPATTSTPRCDFLQKHKFSKDIHEPRILRAGCAMLPFFGKKDREELYPLHVAVFWTNGKVVNGRGVETTTAVIRRDCRELCFPAGQAHRYSKWSCSTHVSSS